MTEIFELSNQRIRSVTTKLHRFLYHAINWEGRLTEIYGPRGVGKTTMLLQKAQEINRISPNQALYVSLDDILFFSRSIVETADMFSKFGGKYLFLDEVHKYPPKFRDHDWSAEIKNIYDRYPELFVIYSGSSILKLHKGRGDLSRRRQVYHLPGLSFREFILFSRRREFPAVDLAEIITRHTEITQDITHQIKIIPVFFQYLKHGYYPFYAEAPEMYFSRLQDIISVILETDIPAVTDIPFETTAKLKKLLAVIAGSVPFTPNLSRSGRDLNITDQRTLLKYLHYLGQAELIALLSQEASGNQILRKPEKIYMDNTNLLNCFDMIPEPGTVRETFFYNQTRMTNKPVWSKTGDFLLDNQWVFEVGGKNKKGKQIDNLDNAFRALDGIETGYGNIIPLWLLGFLY
jgi:predicted AAA+ superfamily ATPase